MKSKTLVVSVAGTKAKSVLKANAVVFEVFRY
jgi:hypothetical protein